MEILRKVQKTDGPYLLHQALYKDYDGDVKNEHGVWNEKENQHIDLLLRDGFLRYEDEYFDIGSNSNAPDDVFVKKYLCLTGVGHDHLEASNWLLRAWRNIKLNVATLITAVFISWAIYYFGPN